MAKYFLVMNDQIALELHNHRKETLAKRGSKRVGDPITDAVPAKQYNLSMSSFVCRIE